LVISIVRILIEEKKVYNCKVKPIPILQK